MIALLAGLAAASADGRTASAQDNAANVAAARRHFDKARAEYAQGAYREAIAELEAAHALDPAAKDLIFNLGVVHEKLSDIDDALQWFQLYTTLNLTPQERERADAYIRRLEGAKKELAQRQPGPPQPGTVSPPPPDTPLVPMAPPSTPPPTRYGRMDAATVTMIGVSGAALAFGTAMGIKATADQPTGFVTGRDGSIQDLQNKQNTAHKEAIFADVGFGVSIAAGITATILYFARPRDGAAAPPTTGGATVSAAPITGGGALIVQGSL